MLTTPTAGVELLAPAGDRDCLRAAIANGADAVYFGLDRFNARLRADNFTVADLPWVVEFCHRRGVRAYATLNILVFTAELPAVADYLRHLNAAGVDGVLVQDVGVARLARRLTPDLPLHASTQMTVTSPAGLRFARGLGCCRVVLARELALSDLRRLADEKDSGGAGSAGSPELEVFVHGALCVAYGGQCLTSEALGQRSANRGECAQACRLPYRLVVDGDERDLGDRRYLLSPHDLAAVDDLPALLAAGVTAFKIEGRLKSPEYVAAVTRVYRRALDAALAGHPARATAADRYALEMTFSRGFHTGWLHGIDHRRLVGGRFGKKRGPLAGMIGRVGRDHIELVPPPPPGPPVPLRPGDGVAFDTGGDPDHEQGGRLYAVRGNRLYFGRGKIDFTALNPGDRVWKTDDPALVGRLRTTYAGRIPPRRLTGIALTVAGKTGEPLRAIAAVRGAAAGASGGPATAESDTPLVAARTAPLTAARLREHLGRLGEAGYEVVEFADRLAGPVILPLAALNRLRRALVAELDRITRPVRRDPGLSVAEVLAATGAGRATATADEPAAGAAAACELAVLCRTDEQLAAVAAGGARTIYLEFEDLRRYRAAVEMVRALPGAPREIFLATPRIERPGEEGFYHLIAAARPDGVLARNVGAIEFFRGRGWRVRGDFSLNVANPLAAAHFVRLGLERVTVAYDLDVGELLALLEAAPPRWFEVTLHQHLPLFHMEHCVFAAFLSAGGDHTTCGRPCDRQRVALRDRVGVAHPVRADAGCRNTVYHAVPQTGAQFFARLKAAGLRHYRLELLAEDGATAGRLLAAYRALLADELAGDALWRSLRATGRLGVTGEPGATRGTF